MASKSLVALMFVVIFLQAFLPAFEAALVRPRRGFQNITDLVRGTGQNIKSATVDVGARVKYYMNKVDSWFHRSFKNAAEYSKYQAEQLIQTEPESEDGRSCTRAFKTALAKSSYQY